MATVTQAETVTDIIAETQATDLPHVATKADIAMLRMLGQTGLIVASIKLLS